MNWSHCASVFMIFLLLHDFSLQKELETRAGMQQLMEKLLKSQGIQPCFRFNGSGTDPDFGTGLNSMDWRGKDRQGLSLWGEICSFCSSKSQNVTIPGQLLFSWLPNWAEFSQCTKTEVGGNSKRARGIIQLSQKILGKGRSWEDKLKVAFSRVWGDTRGGGNSE